MNEICFLHINLKVWKFQKTMLKRKTFFDRFSPPFSHFFGVKMQAYSNIKSLKHSVRQRKFVLEELTEGDCVNN